MDRHKTKLLLFFIAMCVGSINVLQAQNACDKLFASGIKLQQTMTVASQKNAITYFEKAKACYDSQAKKDLCDEQIKACRNIMAQITKSNEQQQQANPSGGNEPDEKESPVASPVRVDQSEKRDVKLSIDCTYLKFKGKGGEFKKAKVTCNYPDWKITEMPSWVSCSRNEDNEIVVEVEKNPTKDERSGILKVECGNESATLTIIQEKMKKFVVI